MTIPPNTVAVPPPLAPLLSPGAAGEGKGEGRSPAGQRRCPRAGQAAGKKRLRTPLTHPHHLSPRDFPQLLLGGEEPTAFTFVIPFLFQRKESTLKPPKIRMHHCSLAFSAALGWISLPLLLLPPFPSQLMHPLLLRSTQRPSSTAPPMGVYKDPRGAMLSLRDAPGGIQSLKPRKNNV